MDTRRQQRLLLVLQQQGGQHIARPADLGQLAGKADDSTDHRPHIRQAENLKYSLAPFVASSAAEQARFYEFFDDYVREQAGWADAWLREQSGEEEPPRPTDKAPSPDYSLPVLLTALLFLLLVAVLRQYEPPPPPPLRIQLPAALQPTPADPYPVLREGSSYRFSALPAAADTAGYRWAVYDTLSGRRLQAGSGRYFELAAAAYGRPQRLVVRAPDKRADSLLLRIHCAQPPAMPDWQVSATPALPGQAYRFAVAPRDTAVTVRWVFNQQDTLAGAAVTYPPSQGGKLVVECLIARQAADCYSREQRTFGGSLPLLSTAALRYDEEAVGRQRPRRLLWLLCLLPLLPAAWLLRRWQQRGDKQPADRPAAALAAAHPIHDRAPYYIPYRSPDSHISCPPDFFRMAELLRRREEGERSDIDIEGSIQATIEGGGYPVLRDKRDTRPGDYLLLIERGADLDQQTRLFGRLAAFFISQDAPVRVYFHDGSFHRFWNGDHPGGVTFAFLQKQYDNHRLVLIGSGHGLLDHRQPELCLQPPLLAALQHWPQRLCLTPLPVSGWYGPEVLLHRHFLLYPADSAGIDAGLQALSELEDYEPGPYLLWERALAERRSDLNPRFRSWDTVEDHRAFLANDPDAFRWLCGLAVCVSPDFALTVAIGRRLGIEVTHDRLLRLSRIPWLDRNAPDDQLRLALLAALEPEEEILARQAVADELSLLRDSVAESFARIEWETSLAVQQFALSPHDRAHRQLLRELLQLGLFSGSQQAELDGLVQRRLQPQAGEGFGIVDYLQQPEPRPFFTAPLLLALACLGLSLGLLLAALQQPPRLPAALVETMPDEAQRWHNAGVDTARQLLLPADYDRWRARAGADSSAAALFEKALRARGSYPLASYHRRVLDYNMGAQGFNFALGDKIAGSAEPPAGLLPAGQQQGAAVPGLAAELPPEVLRSRRFQALLSAAGRFAAAAAGTAADDRLGWAARHGYGLCQYYLAADYRALPPDSARASYMALEALTEGVYFDSLQTVMPVNLETLLGVWVVEKEPGVVAVAFGPLKEIEPPAVEGMVYDSLAGALVLVAGGSFDMGCTSEQRDCLNSEYPIHRVTLDSFYLGQYEVTVQQFKTFIEASAYVTDADREGWSFVYDELRRSWTQKNGINWRHDAIGALRTPAEYTHPVIHVSWNDARAYCEWLSRQTGEQYRLPTEAEWEFAARGGNDSKGYQYAGSDNLDEVGWYAENSGGKTHPVGQKKRNELGLYDMSGNVWEWCQDWYGDYPSSAQTNPTGPTTGSGRVDRGGSWYFVPQYCRVANRFFVGPGYRNFNVGFRLARTP